MRGETARQHLAPDEDTSELPNPFFGPGHTKLPWYSIAQITAFHNTNIE
ncbi:Pc-fam-1 protein [Roseibium sp. TrichSKD4]|nr:Pc-fam-1 protein [Roseibium sp. TrichSKD4]